jgi:hypothetical protein
MSPSWELARPSSKEVAAQIRGLQNPGAKPGATGPNTTGSTLDGENK